MKNEVWKKIKYSDEYEVSNRGRFRHLYLNRFDINTNKIKKISHITYIRPVKRGNYCRVRIYSDRNNFKTYNFHTLVAEAFLDKNNYKSLEYENNIDIDKLIVNHKNENKSDNRIENLEWVTNAYNCTYSNSKKVRQYDDNMNFIKEWLSPTEASKVLHLSSENITSCCKGKRKTCGNYIWRYAEIEKVE